MIVFTHDERLADLRPQRALSESRDAGDGKTPVKSAGESLAAFRVRGIQAGICESLLARRRADGSSVEISWRRDSMGVKMPKISNEFEGKWGG